MRSVWNFQLPIWVLGQIEPFLIIRNILLGLAFILLARPALALDETVVFGQMIDLYSQDQKCGAGSDFPAWERGQLSNPNDGYRVRYSRFGCIVAPRGSIVVFPGRGEGSFEYYETAIDFIDRGFGPVYVLDHRGQGLSPRLLEDPHKGHVARLEDYVDDALAFVAHVKADLIDLGAGSEPAM